MTSPTTRIFASSRALAVLATAATAALLFLATSTDALSFRPGRSPAATVGLPRTPPAWPANADVGSFVGLVYPQPAPGDVYPAGVDHMGAGLVVDVRWQPGTPAPYTWAHVDRGSEQLLWLQRFVDPAGTPGRRVEVTGAVDLGAVGDGYNLQVNGCRTGDAAPDPEIAALVRSPASQEEIAAEQAGVALADPAPTDPAPAVEADGGVPADLSSDVSAAWRLDRATGLIESVPTAGLVCQTATD